MKRIKNQKGITLVALIITIIVLLILAVVAIRAMQGDGIIAHAKNARDQYEQKAAEENALLSNLTGYITGQVGGSEPSGPELSKIQIGDKVAYDEGYRADKKSDVDTNFQMDDMEWRVLDVEANGTVKLISTQPTESKLTLSGEEGWLNGPTQLDKLCSDLYANGTGVTARSLKAEDINKLANYDPTTYSGYGSKWRYKYNPATEKIQYSTQSDNGVWAEYIDTSKSGESFKDPRETKAIDSTNYQDVLGNPIVAELESNYYYYDMTSKITEQTSDNILVSDFVVKGLDESNSAANSEGVTQWLASNNVLCRGDGVFFDVPRLSKSGNVGTLSGIVTLTGLCLWSTGTSVAGYCTFEAAVRPVVELSANTFSTEKVNGTWQVNI